MKTKLQFTDPNFVLMCALDYVINRNKYAPDRLASEIEVHWADISTETKEYIKRVIKKEYYSCNHEFHKILEL